MIFVYKLEECNHGRFVYLFVRVHTCTCIYMTDAVWAPPGLDTAVSSLQHQVVVVVVVVVVVAVAVVVVVVVVVAENIH